jgi:hypothetical protein
MYESGDCDLVSESIMTTALLYGLTISVMRSQFQSISIPFLSISGTTMTTVHLHNAQIETTDLSAKMITEELFLG